MMSKSVSTLDSNVVEIGEKWKCKISQYNNLHGTNYGMRLLKNKARGNCLFISIEQAFPEYNRNNTRKLAVSYILENKIMTNRLLQQNINDYNSDIIDNTNLLNGIGWPQGGPYAIMESLSDTNPVSHKKGLRQLKNVLSRATYYADNELIEATEQVLEIGIILLSDTLGEISWHIIDTTLDKYVIIYNYDDSHYELVEIKNGDDIYQKCWHSWKEIPTFIKDLIPKNLLQHRQMFKNETETEIKTEALNNHLYQNYE